MGTKFVEQNKVRPSRDFKLQHAGGYIDFIANLFVHQDPSKSFTAMQTIGETSPLAGYGKLIVLPYDNLKQFHNEIWSTVFPVGLQRSLLLAIQLSVQLSSNEKISNS